MTRSEIQALVEKVLREECGIDRPISASDRLSEDLGLDSAGLLNLALEVENAFELMLNEPPEDPPTTVQQLVLLLEERLAEEGRGLA